MDIVRDDQLKKNKKRERERERYLLTKLYFIRNKSKNTHARTKYERT